MLKVEIKCLKLGQDVVETIEGEDMRKDYFGTYDDIYFRKHGIQLAAGILVSHRRKRSMAFMATPAISSDSTRQFHVLKFLKD